MIHLKFNSLSILKFFFIILFLFISQIVAAQCNNISGYTVVKTNTTCSANGTIKITIPNSIDCTGWVAEIVKQGGGTSTALIPQTGGDVIFTSLGVGNYSLRFTDGTTSITHPQTITITTTYVDMTYSFSTAAPTCPNSLDGTLTATVGAGTGIGPFVFTLVSPSLGTFTSAPQTSRSYTFTGLRGGENVSLSITDKVNGDTGCEITVNRFNYITAAQSSQGLAFNDGWVRGFNFYKNCSTCPTSGGRVDMVVNLTNVTTARLNKLNEDPLNAKITIAGVAYPLTFVSSNLSLGIAQYKYDASISGRPALTNGTNVRVDFTDICAMLTRSMAVPMPEDNFSGLYADASSNVQTCASSYRLRIENFPDNGAYRSITFCPQNTLSIKKLRSSVGGIDYYTDVNYPAEISPDPNRPNPLAVSQTNGNNIAGGRAEYYLTEAGTYQIIATDDCHTITRYITISPSGSPLNNATVTEVPSVLQGTSALSINFGTVSYKSPIKIKIRRTDGQTLVGYDAKAPFQLKGQKYVNFPIERDYIFTDNVARNYVVSDLPLGSYIVELTNTGCPSEEIFTVTRNVTLSRPAEYAMLDGDNSTFPDNSTDNAIKVNLGCLGSSQIVFNMGKNSNVSTSGTTELWTATPQGAPLAYVATAGAISGGGTTLQGNFNNLNPGKYLVRVREIYNGFSPAEESVNNPPSGPWQYSIPVTIQEIKPIRVDAATVFCDTSNPNSGIVNVEITEGTVTYPLTFTLYSVANPTVPFAVDDNPFVITESLASLNIRSISFTGVPQGSYFVRVSTPCYSVDTNVTVSTVATVPTAKTSTSTICQGSPAILSVFTTKNLYTVNWTEKNSATVIGTGPSITVFPATTTTYTAHYALDPNYNCGNTAYESDVTITVLPLNLAANVTPSSIDLCGLAGTTIPITVQSSTTGFNYEVLDANGNSFTPAISQAGSGSNLVFNIPINSLSLGNNLKIRPTSSTNLAASCTATLNSDVTIIASPKRNDLTVIGSTVCPNTNGKITINTSENGVEYEVLRDDASLSPPVKVTGDGHDIDLTIPFSQLLTNTNVFTIKVTAARCTPIILSNTATITVLTAPIANAGADFTKTCVTNPNGKTIGMSAVSGNSYTWTAVPASSVALLTASNISNPNASPINPTEYTLTVTDTNGCKATDKVSVLVNLAAPTINLGADFSITCTTNPSGKTLGSTITGATYKWSIPTNANFATTATLPVNPSETTTYTLVATYTSTGCSSADTVNVTVDNAAPSSITLEGIDQPSCFTDKGTIKINSTGISTDSYSINGVDYQSNPVFTNVLPNTYNITVKSNTNGCVSNAISAIVDAQPPTPSTPTISAGSATTFCQGGSVILTSSAASGNKWFKDGNAISVPQTNQLTVTESGRYTVKVANTECTSAASNFIDVTVNPSVAPTPINLTIANDCPLETVDLTTLQPAAVSGIEFEWWTGTITTRTGIAKISNTVNYGTSGAVFLWSKSTSDACYSLEGQRVDVVITPCCVANVGIIENTNSSNLVHYSPADINGYEHKNYSTPNKTVYVLVNELDQKIKYINTASPQFTRVVEGNYKLHALVFGPTVNPTGIVVGNRINQIPAYCGSTASYALRVASNNCTSNPSFTEDIPYAKQYALIDLATNQFIQVSTNGEFATSYTGIPYQVVGFNYTGIASGIELGGTIAGVSATNLDITAGAIISGCTAVTTQIDGIIYNDKDKRCIEGRNDQQGLPVVTLYAKLLNSNNQVVYVSSAIQAPYYTFSMSPDLIDGIYSIILDDNNRITDAVETYPNSWKGNTQRFTIESGQIVEYLSNTANFVPMCMQSATEKPAPKRTPNLQGNTYHFCKGATTSSLSVDAVSGAIVNWYTNATGGDASTIAPIPNTAVVGVKTCYVSQTLNGAESDRTEINIEVHALPEQPTVIAGDDFVGAGTSQIYSVVNASSALSYNWILPSDWTGSSTTKDINVVVGNKSATIGVTATSAYGCVSPIQQLDVRVVIEDDIEVYNSISPNGDGDNDIFRIRNIDFYPENTLSIYNRWGIEVYRVTSYGQNDNFFKGFSDGRSTVSRDVELPEGTYFYTLTYKNTKGIEKNLSGYLYIKQ